MANSKAAKKRIHINKQNQLQNKYYKTSKRGLVKVLLTVIKKLIRFIIDNL